MAACAHFFAAGYLVLLFPSHALWIAVGITAYAAVKEFFFDARYEEDPPQTWQDDLQDFAGYVAGAWVTFLIVKVS